MAAPDFRVAEPADGPDRLRLAVTIFIVAVFFALAVVRFGTVWSRYEAASADARAHSEIFAQVLGDHLSQTIAAIDSALIQLAIHANRVGGADAPPSAWSSVLDASLAGLTSAGSISIVNNYGIVTHSTIPEIVGQSRIDTFLFRRMASEPQGGLVADRLFRSPRHGRMLLPVGRMLATEDGQFDGLVVAALEPERLRAFYRSLNLGHGGIVTVLHPSGEILLSEGANHDAAPELGSAAVAALLRERPRGFARLQFEPDGPHYLTAFRTLTSPYLTLAVSLNEDDALAEWWSELYASLIVVLAYGVLLVIAWWLIVREIRARRAAHFELNAARDRFHAVMYQAPLIVTLKDAAGRFTFVNRVFEEKHGKLENGSPARTAKELFPGALADVVRALDDEVMSSKTAVQRELSYSDAGGSHSILFVKFPLLDPHGNVDAIASFATDLSDQRRVEKWFKATMDHAPLLVSLKDTEGRFIYANRAFEQRVGRKLEEIIGMTTTELFDDEYGSRHHAIEKEIVQNKSVVQLELTAPSPEGPRTLLFVKYPLLDAAGNVEAIGSIAADITEQKRTESQLAHAQRLEAVGQLTGGIAHDFNNLLTVILGNAEILTEKLKDREPLRQLAQTTLDAAESSAALTQRLLAFGRRQMLEARTIDINELIAGMGELIRRSFGERIRIDFQLQDSLWPVTVDPNQLETAILNLMVNARDAMPHGGRIVVQTLKVNLDESYAAQNSDVPPGDYVMVAITDSGHGMRDEVKERAFEPFFTTKEIGKGTGLGLSMVYGFVKQSGGHVKIYSEVGMGTVVRLYFPRADSERQAPGLAPSLEETVPGGGETILLVEDDHLVRAHTERQLSELGYRVICAESPAQALELARISEQPDLLLTDMVMPGGMNGRELAERARERWPTLRVLYTSGYTNGAMLAPLGPLTDLHFLSKPFRRRDLAVKVREALDAPAPPVVA